MRLIYIQKIEQSLNASFPCSFLVDTNINICVQSVFLLKTFVIWLFACGQKVKRFYKEQVTKIHNVIHKILFSIDRIFWR